MPKVSRASASQGRGGVLVLLLLAGAATVHIAGELLFVAAGWRLSVDLMPADAPGRYQSVFATGQARRRCSRRP
jgi:hypothetical protein